MYINANVSNLISKRENDMKFKHKCQLWKGTVLAKNRNFISTL